MTIKQILFAMLIFGTINTTGVAMESHPKAKRFNNGFGTHLDDSKPYNFWEETTKIIEITYDNKEINKGTLKEFRQRFPFNYLAWNAIERNNAFFDPIEQAIFYGNALEKDPSLREALQLIEKAINLTDKKLSLLEEELTKLSCQKNEKQYEDLVKKIKDTKQNLNVLCNTHSSL